MNDNIPGYHAALHMRFRGESITAIQPVGGRHIATDRPNVHQTGQ